jgi:hypothetical protein
MAYIFFEENIYEKSLKRIFMENPYKKGGGTAVARRATVGGTVGSSTY